MLHVLHFPLQVFSPSSPSCFMPWEAELYEPHKQDPVPFGFWLTLANEEWGEGCRGGNLEENEVRVFIFPILSLLGCLWLAVSSIRKAYLSQIYFLCMSFSFQITAASPGPFRPRGGDSFAHIA